MSYFELCSRWFIRRPVATYRATSSSISSMMPGFAILPRLPQAINQLIRVGPPKLPAPHGPFNTVNSNVVVVTTVKIFKIFASASLTRRTWSRRTRRVIGCSPSQRTFEYRSPRLPYHSPAFLQFTYVSIKQKSCSKLFYRYVSSKSKKEGQNACSTA